MSTALLVLALVLPGPPAAAAEARASPAAPGNAIAITARASVAGNAELPQAAARDQGPAAQEPGATAAARPVQAKQAPALSIQADAGAGYRPLLALGDVLVGGALRDVVRSGIPLRLRVTVELWHDRRFFDELASGQSWSTVLFYEPLEGTFALREPGSAPLRRFPSYEAAAGYVQRAYPLALRPAHSGSYYYTARVDIETLSLSDLQELEHWLRGELRPAVGGESSVSSAIADGFRRLFVRVLGMPSRRFEARSPKFQVR